MSQPRGAAAALVLRLSVPAEGELRRIVAEIAAKVAEYLGDARADAATVGAAVEGVAAQVAPHADDITFEFRQSEGELLVVARCGSRSSEVRCPLPA